MHLFPHADFTYSYLLGSNSGQGHIFFRGFIQSLHGNAEIVFSIGDSRPYKILALTQRFKTTKTNNLRTKMKCIFFLLVGYRKGKKEQLYSTPNMLLSPLCIHKHKAIPVLKHHVMKANG
jgi:hypothetical protein